MEDLYLKMNKLDQILSDIGIYLHPEFLKLEFKDKIETKGLDIKKLNEYYLLLTSVNVFFRKIAGYELYFSEFYPQTVKIKKTEAVEHHIHAYLEDLDALKNKVCHFLGMLKNDLKVIAINKNEINQAVKQFIEKVNGVFSGVTKYRHPHHHRGMKFLDGNLIDSVAARFLLEIDNPLRDQLKPEYLEVLKKREVESFEKARLHWIVLAAKNFEQISGLLDEVFKRNRNFIYQILKIQPVREILNKKGITL